MEDGELCLLDFSQPYQRKAELPLPHELPAKCGQFKPKLCGYMFDVSFKFVLDVLDKLRQYTCLNQCGLGYN